MLADDSAVAIIVRPLFFSVPFLYWLLFNHRGFFPVVHLLDAFSLFLTLTLTLSLSPNPEKYVLECKSPKSRTVDFMHERLVSLAVCLRTTRDSLRFLALYFVVNPAYET